jgi:hypothetical protein
LQQVLDSFRNGSWLGTASSAAGGFPPLNVFSKGDDVVVVAESLGLK